MLGKLDGYMQKYQTKLLFQTIHKLNSKWIKNLTVRSETIKLLEENIGSMLFDISLRYIYIYKVHLLRQSKKKANKWNCIKLKSFFTEKETINKNERQPTKWQKLFVYNISDNGLMF